MGQLNSQDQRIIRRKQVEYESGLSRSTIYLRIAQGLWPRPVSIGPRAVGWPAREVAAMNAARISGATESELRTLVQSLVRERPRAAMR
jgi:prophage regulatory protein